MDVVLDVVMALWAFDATPNPTSATMVTTTTMRIIFIFFSSYSSIPGKKEN